MLLMSAYTTITTILGAVVQYLNPWNNWNGVCYNEACKNTAKRLIDDINPKVNPCDNFYKFACGNFMAGKDLRGTTANRFSSKDYEIDFQMKRILEEKPKISEPRTFKIVKRYYQMCMDEKKMDDRGVAPGLAMLEKIGGWPVLGNWDPAKWDILKPEIHAFQLGLTGYNVIEYGFNIDFKDKTKYVIEVQQQELPIPREYLIQGEADPKVKDYFEFMVDMATMFGADSQTAEKAMRQVLQLQIEIAKVVTPEEDRRGFDQQLKEFTIKELDEDKNRLFDWRRLFEGAMSPIKLKDDQKIHIYDLESINKILALINGYPKEVVANYIVWNFAVKMAPYLTTAIRNNEQRLQQVVKGINGRPPRWRECMTELKRLSLVMSALYANHFLDKSSRNKAKAMTKGIQNEMKNVLQKADWIGETTRLKAIMKSNKMEHVVGYPDELEDLNIVEEQFKELNINQEHFFEAQYDLNSFYLRECVRKLFEVSGNRSWEKYTMLPVASAINKLPMNSIVENAGILQEPFFSGSIPSYLNYASLGFIIGHEITHGFDDQGREFDDEGQLREWWDEDSLKKFKNKKQCFIDQYGSFIESVTGFKVNGIITQGENIADNGGLKLAYRAYRRLADQRKKPEPGLPGLKQYTNDQLFFISFASTWCSIKPFELIAFYLMLDEHAPAEWRTNGVVMNMPQFGEVFGCAKGTPMNPTEKCEVW